MSYRSLVMNKLRTFLSLLGITIGIFTIISVFTILNSLEREIRTSIESLGDKVIYVQKWPWEFGGDYSWWKYMNRPVPKLSELEDIMKRSAKTESGAFFINTSKTIQYKSNSAENIEINAVSFDFYKIRNFEIENGRYFSSYEATSGSAKAIIGYEIAKSLFVDEDPISKEIKVSGKRIMIIGVFKKEGSSIFGNSMDNIVLTPINYARNIINIRNEFSNPMIMLKPKSNISLDELTDELRGIMRAIRKLKPKEDDNFALNQTSMITKGFEPIFDMVDVAGLIIGGFSVLVGGFGIANIMFVSVRERTKIIGIQKSLGAKNYFIMIEYLFESVILSLIGGIIGLFLIFLCTLYLRFFTEISVSMSIFNILYGLGISALIGIISGFAPAYSASRLNPVEAMNSNF